MSASQPREPLKFWFNQDPTKPLPLISLYDYRKKNGLIAESMTYDEFVEFIKNDNRVLLISTDE